MSLNIGVGVVGEIQRRRRSGVFSFLKKALPTPGDLWRWRPTLSKPNVCERELLNCTIVGDSDKISVGEAGEKLCDESLAILGICFLDRLFLCDFDGYLYIFCQYAGWCMSCT